MCCETEETIKKIEKQLNELKATYTVKIEPVEKCICKHPIPSILVAAGVGVLIGVAISELQK